MPKIGCLNGLRALAAFSVLTCHCIIWSGWPGSGAPTIPYAGMLAKIAVDWFMILSGFLMVLTTHERADLEPLDWGSSWAIFYVRRIFRIAPAYYVSLLGAFLLGSIYLDGYGSLADRVPYLKDTFYNGKSIDYSGLNLALHGTFVFGLFPGWSFSTQLPDWSLSLEMQFYLIFPLIAVCMIRFGAARVCALLVPISIAAVLWLCPYYREPSLVLFKLPVFLAGMVLCFATLDEDYRTRVKLVVLAILLALTQWQFYGSYTLWLIFAVVFITALTISSWPLGPLRFVGRLFDNPVMSVAADLSYSIYLFHGFFIAIAGGLLFRNQAFVSLNPNLRTFLFFVTVLTGTLLVSVLVYRFVERPGIAVGKRLIPLLTTRRASATQTVTRWSTVGQKAQADLIAGQR